MLFIILFVNQVLNLQIGKVTFDVLFPHDKRLAFVQFDQKFESIPQVGISLIALHVNNEVPRTIGIEPKLLQITQQGFQFQITNHKSKIDHLEYQWFAVIDDRFKVNCETIQKSTTINFGREFWVTPTVQIFLAGFQKESQKGDLKFQLSITRQQASSFDVTLNNQSEHFLKDLLICYIAGPQNVVKSKSLININQKTDEFVDLEGTPENLIYGVSKISNFYGALMIQLGKFEYEQEKPGVGISQIDMTLGLIQNDGMLCPLGYYECNFNGVSIDLCESTSGSQSWKRIKSIKSRKGWNGKFKIDGKTLKTQDANCIQDIQLYLEE
ncbi:unnamed protein product (macronuclear) [Paramecium tetraurelia]|uniref:H-type lectin domain-containing protein n=1 Tax=Paramecium tetraurelia TaxID=5888 RepID=A0DC01_PARTE|nr:uncharacterized protein GSPATT00015445001 [Paramecium tetraurelia]CAK80568.1 unnamed protein product [Paramecium tetraurelia]|eukprot:XP_001447965.1 hypothetical protein (macronuclear) [Paramecium tetraurelia strain d4-2]